MPALDLWRPPVARFPSPKLGIVSLGTRNVPSRLGLDRTVHSDWCLAPWDRLLRFPSSLTAGTIRCPARISRYRKSHLSTQSTGAGTHPSGVSTSASQQRTLSAARKGIISRGRMSAAGRARIAAAQRARWAKVKGKKVVSIAAHERRMSPAARRKIAAAQKARWAKWRKVQKKG